MLTCPSNTNVDIVDGVTICDTCSESDRDCNDRYFFDLKTLVVDNGKSLMHEVHLPQGIHSSVTEEDL